ncbi:hypothetical protein [Treponema pectinovorum]|uniref:hypothetical protein n=1 Tax=Treponema pectinovorum TaxID=164 RepID=UPI0011C83FAE|nr:hypothetical protein [Treponema pectinovorum]
MVGIALLAFFLCAINVVFWLIFLTKFRKLFSTDDIILSTKQDVAKILEDVNRVTSRDIDLIESKIKTLKAAVAEADRHMSVLKAEFEKDIKRAQYSSVLESNSKKTDSFNHQTSIETISKNISKNSSFGHETLSDSLQSTRAYSITEEGEKQLSGGQGELFAEKEERYVTSSSGTKFTVDNVGASVASIPKISNIKFSDNPIKPKKNINEQIKELFQQGYSVELIARELNLTTTEVQFSLDMSL